MNQALLGGPEAEAATIEEKREFRLLCQMWPLLTPSELDRMQKIERGLTQSEYVVLKFGKSEKP